MKATLYLSLLVIVVNVKVQVLISMENVVNVEELDYDDDCDKCDGTGEISTECDNCDNGLLNWNLEFRKGEGIHNMYEDTGNADQPIQYDDGSVAYNHPSLFPSEIKNIVKHIFDNKDLEIEELVNSVVRFMIKDGSFDEYNIDHDMRELLNDDTKRIIQSYKGIKKYDL
jgi:hypothetical protein